MNTNGAKHTPGPWETQNDGLMVVLKTSDRSYRPVCYAGSDYDTGHRPSFEDMTEDRANAALISAAPELLAAANGLLLALQPRFLRTGASPTEESACKALRSTIRKATGHG